jgi:enoyl-CoA hydratase/carnithine racemase
MSPFQTILFKKEANVATVVLNRPKVLNAYNIQMRDDLFQILEAIRDDEEIHGVILTGAGERAFCAGADLTEFGTAPSQVIARQVRWDRDVWGLLIGIDKPVIAALFGYVLGSGVEIACLCDLRVASDDAIFAMPETALGMVPAAGGTQTLLRTIGSSRTLDMLLSGRRFTAFEAFDLGLLTTIVPRDKLLIEARSLLDKILSGDLVCTRLAKRSVLEGMNMPLTEALELEMRLALHSLERQRA